MVQRVAASHTSTAGHDLVTWTGLLAGDHGAPVQTSGARGALASIQVTGTFGTAIVGVEGSNDGATWFPVKDPAGAAAIALSAAGLAEFSTTALMVRPKVTGGDGTTALTAIACLQG